MNGATGKAQETGPRAAVDPHLDVRRQVAATDVDVSAARPRPDYNLALGYLRAFVILLVIAHHSLLGYAAFVPERARFGDWPPAWKAFPVIDTRRWAGFDVLIACNDVFFMSLMFFISGLFVWTSLQRKGRATFLRDRAVRLGVPFLVSAVLIAPLAYYPSYLMTASSPHPIDFLRHWPSLGAGPAWFLWVLLVFDCAAAALFSRSPHRGDRMRHALEGPLRRPAAFFAAIVSVSAAAYLPMLLVFGPFVWPSIGPFTFQASRFLHYGVWFFAGIAIGACGIDRSLLAPDGPLARQWLRWLAVATLLFAIEVSVARATLTPPGTPWYAWGIGGGLAFVLACAALSLSLTAVFLRFVGRPTPVFDSLRDNAYGMYVLHFAFVTWLQYFLLSTVLPGVAKGTIVLIGATLLSWITTAALRRNLAIARII
ncbi:MAG TPA: acyltransferase [Candidatus Eisenbacteria bacterium]|nr:acyltransferase [Candidatus Eisenbacteria bacterium]